MRPCRHHHCADHEGRERECEQWEFRDAVEDQKFQRPRQNRCDRRRNKCCDGEALRIRTSRRPTRSQGRPATETPRLKAIRPGRRSRMPAPDRLRLATPQPPRWRAIDKAASATPNGVGGRRSTRQVLREPRRFAEETRARPGPMPVTAGLQRSYRPWPDWLPRRLRSGRGRHEPPLRAQRPCFELPRSGSSRSPTPWPSL